MYCPRCATQNLDGSKFCRACGTNLETIAIALEAFKRERGSYVESKSEAQLIDFLSPHYLARAIRVDAWDRPYEYEGT